MKSVIGLALALVVLVAAPAAAHVAVTPGSVATTGSSSDVMPAERLDLRSAGTAAGSTGEQTTTGGTGAPSTYADDDGVDGTDTATFVALMLGGAALVAAVAALIMGRKRVPA